MNLNKQMKEEIVRRVVNDIPRKHSCPTHFQNEVKRILDEDARLRLPAEIYKLWSDPKTRMHLATASGNVLYMVRIPSGKSRYSLENEVPYFKCETTRPHACAALAARAVEKLQALFDQCEAERDQIEAAKSRLESALAGVRTRKSFLQTFPELEKYAPEEVEYVGNLPALANVVADLAKLGWPKPAAA